MGQASASDPSATVSLLKSGQSERLERTFAAGVQIKDLPFARHGVAPGDQGQHDPQCVFVLEVAAKSADTCSW